MLILLITQIWIMEQKKEKPPKNPLAQKTKLLTQLKAIQNKLAEFDKTQAQKIALMAKQYQLTDLSDDVIENEFQLIQKKYQTELTKHDQVSKKN